MAGSGSNPNPAKDQPSSSQSPFEEDGLTELIRILVVEDNPSDLYLIRSAIEASGLKASITVQTNGELATNFFDEVDGNAALFSPDLVILDLNLPKLGGPEVLEYMRRSPRCQKAIVIVASTSGLESDRERVLKLGADAYFRKPSGFDEFLKLGDVIRACFRKPGRQ